MYVYEFNQDRSNSFYMEIQSTLNPEKHFHNGLEVVYVLNGDVTAHIDGEIYHLVSDQLCAVSCFSTHYYEKCKEGEYVFCSIPNRYFREYQDVFNANSFCNPVVTDVGEKPFLGIFRNIENALCDRNVFGNPTGAQSDHYRESQLHFWGAYITDLLINHCGLHERHRTSSLVADAVQVIENNFKNELTVEMICRKTGCHQKILSNCFKKTMGMSITNYIDKTRVLEAARLLNADSKMTVESIMLESGFNSVRNFLRHFKAIYGCTPTEYRNTKRVSASEKKKTLDQ